MAELNEVNGAVLSQCQCNTVVYCSWNGANKKNYESFMLLNFSSAFEYERRWLNWLINCVVRNYLDGFCCTLVRKLMALFRGNDGWVICIFFLCNLRVEHTHRGCRCARKKDVFSINKCVIISWWWRYYIIFCSDFRGTQSNFLIELIEPMILIICRSGKKWKIITSR